jgi:hypothetical protein
LDAFRAFAFALGALRLADFPPEDFFLAAFFLAAGLDFFAAFFLVPPAAFPAPARLVGADVGADRVAGEDDPPPNVLVRAGEADPLPAPKPLPEPADD